MKKQETTIKTREQQFAERADHSYPVCYTQMCPLREHCLHYLICSYVPKDRYCADCINLNNPEMQTDRCPMYMSDKPIRMAMGISKMYYNMPRRIEVALKRHLIYHFNRKRYYEYHSGYRPVPPEHEQYIRQAARKFGWKEPLEFNGYVEDYLW